MRNFSSRIQVHVKMLSHPYQWFSSCFNEFSASAKSLCCGYKSIFISYELVHCNFSETFQSYGLLCSFCWLLRTCPCRVFPYVPHLSFPTSVMSFTMLFSSLTDTLVCFHSYSILLTFYETKKKFIRICLTNTALFSRCWYSLGFL